MPLFVNYCWRRWQGGLHQKMRTPEQQLLLYIFLGPGASLHCCDVATRPIVRDFHSPGLDCIARGGRCGLPLRPRRVPALPATDFISDPPLHRLLDYQKVLVWTPGFSPTSTPPRLLTRLAVFIRNVLFPNLASVVCFYRGSKTDLMKLFLPRIGSR